MMEEEFQKTVLQELKAINGRLDSVEGRLDGIEGRLDSVEGRLDGIEGRLDSVEGKLDGIETRQDEIYQVVRAIEHSNQVGRSEIDSQNIRIAKLEGKYKRVAKAYNEEVDIDQASNL